MRTKLLANEKLNNKGATLIELLIVIAILAVLISGAIIGFTVLNSSNLKQATRTTKTYLEKTRTSTMSVMADEWYLELSKNSTDYVVAVYKTYTVNSTDAEGNVTTETKTDKIEEKELGSKFTLTLDDSVKDELEINENNKLKVTFNAASGGVKDVVVLDTLGNVVTDEYGDSPNLVTLKFAIDSKEAMVDLYFISGKVEITD